MPHHCVVRTACTTLGEHVILKGEVLMTVEMLLIIDCIGVLLNMLAADVRQKYELKNSELGKEICHC